MEYSRGILLLKDPLCAESASRKKSEYTNSITLIFDENGRYLSLAQAALWDMRQRFNWVCVAAEGMAACIAVALAAQLPVDRLVLIDSGLFMSRRKGMPRELVRLTGYARRNFSLVISEILLLNCRETEIKGFHRGRRQGRICVMESGGNGEEICPQALVAPWERLGRNNLLIPSECV